MTKIKKYDNQRPVTLILQDGFEIDYSTLKALAMSLGWSEHTIHAHIVSGRCIDYGGSVFCTVRYNDGLPNEIEIEVEPTQRMNSQSVPVVVTFEDGTERKFVSVAECIRELKVAGQGLRQALHTGEPHKRGFTVRQAV